MTKLFVYVFLIVLARMRATALNLVNPNKADLDNVAAPSLSLQPTEVVAEGYLELEMARGVPQTVKTGWITQTDGLAKCKTFKHVGRKNGTPGHLACGNGAVGGTTNEHCDRICTDDKFTDCVEVKFHPNTIMVAENYLKTATQQTVCEITGLTKGTAYSEQITISEESGEESTGTSENAWSQKFMKGVSVAASLTVSAKFCGSGVDATVTGSGHSDETSGTSGKKIQSTSKLMKDSKSKANGSSRTQEERKEKSVCTQKTIPPMSALVLLQPVVEYDSELVAFGKAMLLTCSLGVDDSNGRAVSEGGDRANLRMVYCAKSADVLSQSIYADHHMELQALVKIRKAIELQNGGGVSMCRPTGEALDKALKDKEEKEETALRRAEDDRKKAAQKATRDHCEDEFARKAQYAICVHRLKGKEEEKGHATTECKYWSGEDKEDVENAFKLHRVVQAAGARYFGGKQNQVHVLIDNGRSNPLILKVAPTKEELRDGNTNMSEKDLKDVLLKERGEFEELKADYCNPDGEAHGDAHEAATLVNHVSLFVKPTQSHSETPLVATRVNRGIPEVIGLEPGQSAVVAFRNAVTAEFLSTTGEKFHTKGKRRYVITWRTWRNEDRRVEPTSFYKNSLKFKVKLFQDGDRKFYGIEAERFDEWVYSNGGDKTRQGSGKDAVLSWVNSHKDDLTPHPRCTTDTCRKFRWYIEQVGDYVTIANMNKEYVFADKDVHGSDRRKVHTSRSNEGIDLTNSPEMLWEVIPMATDDFLDKNSRRGIRKAHEHSNN